MMIPLGRTLLLKYKSCLEKNIKCNNNNKTIEKVFLNLNNWLLYFQLLQIVKIVSGKYLVLS